MKLLIIEDEAKTAAYLRKGLVEHGFVVDIATRGDEGLDLEPIPELNNSTFRA